MRHSARSGRIVGAVVTVVLFASIPLFASAFWAGFPFGGGGGDQQEQESRLPFKFCDRTINAAGFTISFKLPGKVCDDTPPPPPPPPPPPVDVCPNVPGTQTAGPCADQECIDDGGTWDGDSCELPPPPPPEPALDFTAGAGTINEGGTTTLSWDSTNATSCTASNGWSGSKPVDGSEIVGPTATTTYSLSCTGDGGTIAKNVTVNVILDTEPEPEPEGKLLITEVLYDLTSSTTASQGSEPANEWVEIYNGTLSDINLSDYSIADASSTDALPSVVLPAGKFAVIVASSTTASFYTIPGDAVIAQLANTTVGNGLSNTGDMVSLIFNVGTTTVDAVSWGTNTTAFSPSIQNVDVNAGHSINRVTPQTDTDTAVDWEERDVPTPGV